MILDETYFAYEPLHIPFAEASGVGVSKLLDTKKKEQVLNTIATRELQFLKELLGKDLRDAFLAGLNDDPIEQKWIDLRDKIYDSANKISPVANYVYYFYIDPTKMTDVGIAIAKSDNLINVSPLIRQVEVWNDMADLNLEIVEWLDENSDVYEIDDIEYPRDNWAKDYGILDYINRLV
jgi:hypothetical protein